MQMLTLAALVMTGAACGRGERIRPTNPNACLEVHFTSAYQPQEVTAKEVHRLSDTHAIITVWGGQQLDVNSSDIAITDNVSCTGTLRLDQ